RAADYVRAYPDQVSILLSVELCSLTLQLKDFSIPNLISSGLFGDGAAAAILVGDERQAAGPRVVATRSIFYPHTEQVTEISSWVAHTGGPKVLQAMEESLELGPEALAITWRSLEQVGNLSSTSVLIVLEEMMYNHRPAAGSFGLLLALGPGFCSELVLLQW
ncbi:MAG: 3-oxoacyl-[acyl-carrier-protein] synthase III C-terminal domain-containing protein, partial [Acidobacteriota bacterium]